MIKSNNDHIIAKTFSFPIHNFANLCRMRFILLCLQSSLNKVIGDQFIMELNLCTKQVLYDMSMEV